MELADINVLIYAHREAAPEHDRYAPWLRRLAAGAEPFALSSFTLGGFLRIVTNPRIFDPATPLEVAISFCEKLLERPQAVLMQPSRRHWDDPRRSPPPDRDPGSWRQRCTPRGPGHRARVRARHHRRRLRPLPRPAVASPAGNTVRVELRPTA